ncbi:MAG TPA: MmgE/PrpD family protein [Burkholderiales bacterium]|nr:MmgE/PrpD family protein [Burkholderiales bacterium]
MSAPTVAEQVGEWAAALQPPSLPTTTQSAVRRLMLDITGLCVAARKADYIKALLASAVAKGNATAIGHASVLSPYDAALVNGSAAHGEDFDDTFEGGPIHAGAAIVPAALALAEHRGLDGAAVTKGIVVGTEFACRASMVAPQAIHRAGFHPSGVLCALGAAAAGAAMLGLPPRAIAHSIGIAGSFASGIIEYLADGAWTKRFHPGWAAQAGIRAALLAEAGFTGPLSVLEGTHGFYKAFAPSKAPDFRVLLGDLGTRYVIDGIAFKPYACGTMTHPYIDCMMELRGSGVRPEEVMSVVCEVAEGTVHRLWEPIQAKRRVPNGYVAKFSAPYCIAVGFLDGAVGFEQFTDERAADPALQAFADRISYVIDPKNPYPRGFTGHVRVTLRDGSVREIRRPHFRGGAHAPIPDDELERKYWDNCRFGGWRDERAAQVARAIDVIAAGGRVDLSAARA